MLVKDYFSLSKVIFIFATVLKLQLSGQRQDEHIRPSDVTRLLLKKEIISSTVHITRLPGI